VSTAWRRNRSAAAFAAALLTVLPGCPGRRRAPPGPLVWTLLHPVETPWAAATGGPWEVRFSAHVGSDGARDTPPSRTYPCVRMEVRSTATGKLEGGGGVACDETAAPTSPGEMTLAAEALLGAPTTRWSFGGRFLVARGPRWAHGFVVMPPGSTPGFRQGSVDRKTGDVWNDGIKCDAWGSRSDCIIQEYESTLRKVPDVRQVVGFLSDTPDRSAVLLVVAPASSPAALEAKVLADNPGLHLPMRVRLWPSLATAPTSEELWTLMDLEGKMPP
jgi:hypothetical protein